MQTTFQKINIKPVAFTSLEQLNDYIFMSKVDRTKLYSTDISSYVKAISKDYFCYYDQSNQLWSRMDNNDFVNFTIEYHDAILKNINKFVSTIPQSMQPTNKTFNQLLKSLDTRSYCEEISKLALSFITNSLFITQLDVKPYIFSIKDGNKIDFRTLEVTKRERDDFLSYESNVELVDKTPNADKFFKQIMPDETSREYLRKVLGYSITAETCERVFYIWYGHGSNGKSVVTSLMQDILLDKYVQCDKSIFIKSSNSNKGGPSPELMSLMGKYMAVYSEGETSDRIEMNLSGLKQISGEDTISARQLYAQPIEFKALCKAHLLTNFTPGLNDEKSIVDRVRYIFMDARFTESPKKGEFKKDVEFISRLRKVHLSEVFSWIAKGANEFYKANKTIAVPDSFQSRTTDLFNSEDSITTFINRMLVVTEDKKDFIKKGQLFENYQAFCIDNSQKCHRRSELFDRLKEKRFITSVKDGYDVYRKVKLNTVLLKKKSGAQSDNMMICDDDEYKEAYELSQTQLKASEGALSLAMEEIGEQRKVMEDMERQAEDFYNQIEALKKQLQAKSNVKTESEQEFDDQYSLSDESELIEDTEDEDTLRGARSDDSEDEKPIVKKVIKHKCDKIFLFVPFEYKNHAKAFGAHYDHHIEDWYTFASNIYCELLVNILLR